MKVSRIFHFRFEPDPVKAINFLKTIGRLWTIWPLNKKASKTRRIYHEYGLWFKIINSFVILSAVYKAILESHGHPVTMAKAMSQLMIGIDALSHTLFYIVHRAKLQVLVEEILDFMRSCQSYKRIIMRSYYKQFFPLYMTLFVLYSIAAGFFFCVSFITKKKFPVDATYPFSTESTLVIIIIYTHQTYTIIQNAVIIMIDFFVITLFWYAGARLKILEHHLESVKNDETFVKCIIDHQEVIRFIQTAVYTARFILYKTISVVGMILISAGIQLIYFDAAAILSQFTLIVIVASLRIITYSLTIGKMKQLNNNLRWKVYRSDRLHNYWINKKSMAIFIQRCQTPLVTVNGYILHIMSLRFFTKFMYTIISHLITVRAIIERSSGSN